ncbi:hypothetical protein HY312_00505 [Candidatus Saccharibacteria bacterium]|nr:hypothetical protein [Candidatus Saccharibacteria bacterium]
MSMYTLKSIVQRGTMLGAAGALLVAAVVPASSAFADALNPLTERSLALSSSAPGYTDTDGSGNAETAYSPAGSGPNGKKTGQTFTFKVSTNSSVSPAIKAFTLQYCTTAAGNCFAPGDNTGDASPNGDSDLSDSTRLDNATSHPLGKSDLDVVGTFANTTTTAAAVGGQFQVLVGGVAQNGWSIETINAEDHITHTAPTGVTTGKKNMIRLTNGTGINPAAGEVVQIVFKASTSAYITNPGSGSFFVKINTYKTDALNQLIPNIPSTANTNIVDGGVTVANVMTDSIHITTKVLETMSFSVGTENRDTTALTGGNVHGTCDPILAPNDNRLNLGNPNAEYSLETTRAWDVNSYWRLSSNSSGGATVYYSGNTLANTVGDEIAEVGETKAASTPGTEQFGLGFVDAGLDTFDGAFTTLVSAPNSRHKTPESFPFRTLSTQTSGKYAIGTLPAQPISTNYNAATGSLYDDTDPSSVQPGTAQFAFQKSSLTTPVPIAQQNDQVISCATAKMRYVGNIGADTPAGVYTTKINYLAAPQY